MPLVLHSFTRAVPLLPHRLHYPWSSSSGVTPPSHILHCTHSSAHVLRVMYRKGCLSHIGVPGASPGLMGRREGCIEDQVD